MRDGTLLRPVAPFLELWALTGDGSPTALTPIPLTTDLLAANRASSSSLTFTLEAMNRKAERRGPRGGAVRPADLRFGTFPPVRLRGDDHRAVELLGVSPPAAARPMIPQGRNIPLGRLQVMRPVPQPASPPWPDTVRTDVVRVRFTPARGRFYGPPDAARPVAGAPVPAVPRERAFLDPQAGWFNAPRSNRTVPADTVDETANGRSLGVVDDTCDGRLLAELVLPGGAIGCRASISVGPPHYACDRRPFLSLADEIIDRERDGATGQPRGDELTEWVEDLFERVYESVSAIDVDWWRALAARPLEPDERRNAPIPSDGVPQPERAMGGLDLLRDPDIAVPPPSPNLGQPLSQRARDRHRNLSDLNQLTLFVRANPDRMRQLIRAPFFSPPRDGSGQSMQMPPFMRNSNGRALSLTAWQYEFLMAWVDEVAAAPERRGVAPPAPLSPEASERRRQILSVLQEEDGQ